MILKRLNLKDYNVLNEKYLEIIKEIYKKKTSICKFLNQMQKKKHTIIKSLNL